MFWLLALFKGLWENSFSVHVFVFYVNGYKLPQLSTKHIHLQQTLMAEK
jgi:hypothetical protein